MIRHTSTALLGGLCLTLVYSGCSSNSDDDEEQISTINTTSSGTDATSVGGSGVQAAGGTGNGSGTTTTDGAGGGQGTPIDEACPTLNAEVGCGDDGISSQKQLVNMLIVLDKSGSMSFVSGGQEKWSAVKEALDTALHAVEDDINFGLQLYPFHDYANPPISADNCSARGDCCDMPTGDDYDPNVPIYDGQGPDQVTNILATLDEVTPGGGTPTAPALERALNYFTQGAGSLLSGDKFVLLATDGGPNCNAGLTCGADLCTNNLDGQTCENAPDGENCCDEEIAGSGIGCLDHSNVTDQIEALGDAGVDTIVIGIPGSEAFSSYLADFAVAGGRPLNGDTYYRVDDVSDLAQVLEDITISLIRDCDIQLDQTPTEQPQIAIDCELISRFDADDNEQWTWSGDQIQLNGDLCDSVQSQGAERIDVIFGCGGVR